MTTSQAKSLTVEVSKVISAPVDKVFRAWTEPKQLQQWFGCNSVMNLSVGQDARVGGKYEIEADSCEAGSKRACVSGEYKEVVPNKKLVFTWNNSSTEFPAKDTLVTVEFVDKGEATEVKITHTRFVAQPTADRHNQGWTECLEKLARFVA